MIGRLLIANRGEIARRIMRTCRRLGIETVAVFSEADRGALHVTEADQAFEIGPAPARDSYLNGGLIFDVARQSGADAVHPGYGFLSENSHFARSCAEAGLVFVGPGAITIERMGNKDEAKSIMQKAGVPVVPGYHGERQDEGTLAKQANDIGFPLMIKACAGGGGKGMRIVNGPADFTDALAGARREAQSSFSDDRVLLERYLHNPRHVEIQVFGDSLGRYVHLFERECSVQRRYQKIIEESPSPAINEHTRVSMADAAVAAARAVDYTNAGTVEFIVAENGEFFFMEMNTRLQVEHPVTEMITGLDLVEWQLRVAAGETLPLTQDQISRRGHAIEARVYAENPFHGFLPATGTIEKYCCPVQSQTLRIDTGVESGSTVGIHYDPMVAKIIVHGDDRRAAIEALHSALNRTALFGLRNNLPLLRAIVRSEVFGEAGMHTAYLDRHLQDFLDDARAGDEMLAAAAIDHVINRTRTPVADVDTEDQVPDSPWDRGDGWRLGGTARSRVCLGQADGHTSVVEVVTGTRSIDQRFFCAGIEDRKIEAEFTADGLRLDGIRHDLSMQRFDRWRLIELDGCACELESLPPYGGRQETVDDHAHPGSPLPGKIVSLFVDEGDRVSEGDKLLVLEGMKMEYTLLAKTHGMVEKIMYRAGDIVEAEVPLIDISPDHDEDLS